MNRIVWAGDSTVKYNKIDTYPQTGISQGMLLYLQDQVILRSFAENGRSTKSFIDQGRLDLIDDYLEEGDFLFIQFGHNDAKKEDPTRWCDADTDFQSNLMKFIAVAEKHKAYPVLITPIARRYFDEHGVYQPGSHGKYPDAVKKVAEKAGVPVIDMTTITEQYLASIGDFASRPLYVYPKDNTHLQMQGAVVFAGFIARELAALGAPYNQVLVETVCQSCSSLQQMYAQEIED